MELPATRPMPTQIQAISPWWAMSSMAARMARSMPRADRALALRAVLTAERRLIPRMKRTEATMYMT